MLNNPLPAIRERVAIADTGVQELDHILYDRDPYPPGCCMDDPWQEAELACYDDDYESDDGGKLHTEPLRVPLIEIARVA